MDFQYKSVTWDYFEQYIFSTAQNLLTDEYFTDVTLVSEDHKPFRAHKVILSACSPVLQTLLLMNAPSFTQQTILYLRGIHSQEMEALLEFIYLGKTTINRDNVEEFLAITHDLKISGLSKEKPDFDIVIRDDLPNKSVENAEEKKHIEEKTETRK